MKYIEPQFNNVHLRKQPMNRPCIVVDIHIEYRIRSNVKRMKRILKIILTRI